MNSSIQHQRHWLYTTAFRWVIRFYLVIYTIITIAVSSSVTTLDNICNWVIVICIFGVLVDMDIVPIVREYLIEPYDFVFSIKRKSKLQYLLSYNFSTARNDSHQERLFEYPMGHYIYVLKDASASGYYKIGRTNLPRRRIGRFEVILPIELHIMFIIPCENEIVLESILHNRFHKQRIQGEWFNLTAEDIHWFMITYGLR